MKTKIISSASEQLFKRELDKFLRGVTPKSVQFSTCQYNNDIMYSALILYV